MPKIEIRTKINASPKTVFDLSRSIDIHMLSTKKTNEKAIAGRTSGLIELGETVTWRAKHFGIYQKLTVKITEFESPHFFVDEMVRGAFKGFRHEHHFSKLGKGTLMLDIFDYESPFGILGKLVDYLVLEKYMAQFLTERNLVIKEIAESQITEPNKSSPQ